MSELRLNKYVALALSISRRKADTLIQGGQILVNGAPSSGQLVTDADSVEYQGKKLTVTVQSSELYILHKPVGYVCSRNGQGNNTIYDLLPTPLRHLKPIGRLDKNTSGLLLFTNDGSLMHQLMHPSYQKEKVYIATTNRPILEPDLDRLKKGVRLEDGLSRFIHGALLAPNKLELSLEEGRNRQIRRTFEAIGYRVVKLHRIQFGEYRLANLKPGDIKKINQICS